MKSLGPVGILSARQLARAERGSGELTFVRVAWNRKLALRSGTTDADVFTQHFVRRELYELPQLACVEVIVDLGAHAGIATEVFRRQYPQARIVSVEMNRSNYELCERNHADTPLQESIHAAIWSESGFVHIDDVGEGNWAFRVSRIPTDELPPTLVPVPALSFTELVQILGISRIQVLKIDIEGSEAELLESAWREIFRLTDFIAMEIHDWIPMCRERVERVLVAAREEFDLEVTQAGEFTCIRPHAKIRGESFADQAVNA